MTHKTIAERNAEILRRFKAGEDAADIAADYDIVPAHIANIIRSQTPWDEIALDGRVYRALVNEGIDPTDIDAVARLNPSALLRWPNFGARSLHILRDYLRKHGRDFPYLASPQPAVTTPEQARQRWVAAVLAREEADQAVREARDLADELQRMIDDEDYEW